MVELYGICQDIYNPEFGYIRNLVATFDSKQEAMSYVEASHVQPSKRLFKKQPFHSASVLGAYTDYEIEEVEKPSIPHNPSKNWE